MPVGLGLDAARKAFSFLVPGVRADSTEGRQLVLGLLQISRPATSSSSSEMMAYPRPPQPRPPPFHHDQSRGSGGGCRRSDDSWVGSCQPQAQESFILSLILVDGTPEPLAPGARRVDIRQQAEAPASTPPIATAIDFGCNS
jgi:hypothetical protein